MDTFDESLNFILERALDTHQTMVTLAAPPYNWAWTGESPGNFLGRLDFVNAQIPILARAEATTSGAAGQWDRELAALIAEAQLGTQLARVRYQDQPNRLQYFRNLEYRGTGRDARYSQALAFEVSWEKAEPGWVFKPLLTLAAYRARREAVPMVTERAHVTAVKEEQHQRAVLHDWADEMNKVCVNWYAVATATFAEDTVPGQLVRTIPTTYNPNRPPGRFTFTSHMSGAPNSVHLLWRAPRGEKFYILAQAPGSNEFEVILDGVTIKEWMGLALSAGLWKFKGYATNAHGTGEESDVVEVPIANAQAA
jgi:hypothetical protein